MRNLKLLKWFSRTSFLVFHVLIIHWPYFAKAFPFISSRFSHFVVHHSSAIFLSLLHRHLFISFFFWEINTLEILLYHSPWSKFIDYNRELGGGKMNDIERWESWMVTAVVYIYGIAHCLWQHELARSYIFDI